MGAPDYVRRAKRVEHRIVQPAGVRPIAQDAGGAISRLPRDFGVPDDQFVWLLSNPQCGCAWGWHRSMAGGSPGLERRLCTAGEVEDELRHTAVHHLVAGGLSHQHHAAPGCTR